jgi:hypothetical protein
MARGCVGDKIPRGRVSVGPLGHPATEHKTKIFISAKYNYLKMLFIALYLFNVYLEFILSIIHLIDGTTCSMHNYKFA